MVEEVGDLLWFIAILLDHLDSNFDEAIQVNRAKLMKRYPNGRFNQADAINRNTQAEREKMEETCLRKQNL